MLLPRGIEWGRGQRTRRFALGASALILTLIRLPSDPGAQQGL
ncbi:MAG: hypothetical protein ACU0GG_02080 [Paracoccaceae bacterium]